ncbi:uncharacterized protein LOC135398678 [Ornithodoros turicata]|uniref:uncharacterized protein LOC135398678 n=1 Tax=Ornithodoros turicata TaxID=34597 RepID=UPI003138AEE0
MSDLYKFFIYKDMVFKFKITHKAIIVPNEEWQDIFGAIVYMETENQRLQRLTTGAFAVKINVAPWDISKYVYIRRGRKKLIFFPVQFKLDISHMDKQANCSCPKESNMRNVARHLGYATPPTGKASHVATLSFATPAASSSAAGKRKLHQTNQSNSLALVPKEKSKRGKYCDIPPEVRESVKTIKQKTNREVVIEKLFLPEAMYQNLVGMSNYRHLSPNVNCTIIVTDPELTASPRRAPMDTNMITMGESSNSNVGLLNRISRY